MAAIAAFIRRDFLVWTSYRTAVLTEAVSLAGTIALVYLVGKTLGESSSSFLARYETDYAGYLMTSITFLEVWTIGFLLPRTLRESQATGTLEVMMLSHFGIFRLLTYWAAFPLLTGVGRLLVFAAFAVTVFGLWHTADLWAAAVVFVASLLAVGFAGLLSVAFVLVVKQGDPVVAAYGLLNAIFAGIFFPPEVLPGWLQTVSLLFPLTHALEGMRHALAGQGLAQVAPQVVTLLAFFIVLLPATLWALNWAVRRAKDEGSLVQY